MFDGRDEGGILRLARESIAAMSSCRIEAGYLMRGNVLVPSPRRESRDIDIQVEALHGGDGWIARREHAWCRAFALRHAGNHRGYLVVSAATAPADHEIRLLALFVQQTALALTNAATRHGDGLRIRQLREANAAANDRLAATVSDMEREQSIHRTLYGVPASGTGESGVVEALHTLTGLPAAIEDRFGNLRAWAGPGQPDPYPKPRPQQRRELLRQAARGGPVVRVKDRLVALAHTRDDDLLGVLALVDSDRTAGRHAALALEHGAVVLAAELAHQHDLVELEQRLRSDLVEDLLSGAGGESAYARSQALGHDLHGPHHVALIRWDGGTNGALAQAAEHAAGGLGLTSLVSTRHGTTVLLASGPPRGQDLHDAVAKRVRTTAGSIGIGGRCDCPEELPRSFEEAGLALEIRLTSRTPHGATSFDELGVVRVLDTGDGGAKLRRFMREWLGPLLDYDSRNRSHLVPTLSQHLDCGGNYDNTAAALVIHRSTLRYRLQRIREISGLDLADASNRLNLHVATRAWRILDGVAEQSGKPAG